MQARLVFRPDGRTNNRDGSAKGRMFQIRRAEVPHLPFPLAFQGAFDEEEYVFDRLGGWQRESLLQIKSDSDGILDFGHYRRLETSSLLRQLVMLH